MKKKPTYKLLMLSIFVLSSTISSFSQINSFVNVSAEISAKIHERIDFDDHEAQQIYVNPYFQKGMGLSFILKQKRMIDLNYTMHQFSGYGSAGEFVPSLTKNHLIRYRFQSTAFVVNLGILTEKKFYYKLSSKYRLNKGILLEDFYSPFNIENKYTSDGLYVSPLLGFIYLDKSMFLADFSFSPFSFSKFGFILNPSIAIRFYYQLF